MILWEKKLIFSIKLRKASKHQLMKQKIMAKFDYIPNLKKKKKSESKEILIFIL